MNDLIKFLEAWDGSWPRLRDHQIRRVLEGQPSALADDGTHYWIAHERIRWADGSQTVWPDTPEYTRSIDAAITLMPEDTEWSCIFARQGGFGGVARVWHMDQHEADMGQATTAVTPAIALCIAALNLRAALNIQQRASE